MLNAFIILLLICFALTLWIAWFEPRHLVIRRYKVHMPNLRKPIKAVVIGDIQPNVYHWPESRLRKLFARLSEDEDPELVLWLGDYFNASTDKMKAFLDQTPALKERIEEHLPSMDEIADAMALLQGKNGSFAILGNHDWAWSGNATRQALIERKIQVLQDDIANLELEDEGGHVQILGYEDVSSGRIPNYEKLHGQLDKNSVQIGLSHSPDAFPEALGGPPLMLSGHTHGGQVRLPFIGALVLPIQYPQYDRGWFSERHRRLFVTSGLGTSLPPFRFLCPPEVVVLEFLPEQQGD